MYDFSDFVVIIIGVILIRGLFDIAFNDGDIVKDVIDSIKGIIRKIKE